MIFFFPRSMGEQKGGSGLIVHHSSFLPRRPESLFDRRCRSPERQWRFMQEHGLPCPSVPPSGDCIPAGIGIGFPPACGGTKGRNVLCSAEQGFQTLPESASGLPPFHGGNRRGVLSRRAGLRLVLTSSEGSRNPAGIGIQLHHFQPGSGHLTFCSNFRILLVVRLPKTMMRFNNV